MNIQVVTKDNKIIDIDNVKHVSVDDDKVTVAIFQLGCIAIVDDDDE